MRRGLALLLAGLLISVGAASIAIAHTEEGGLGDDVLTGHDGHGDDLRGGGGCDVVKGEGSPDLVKGGPGACDTVRGGEGWDDDVIVADDQQPNDYATGGAGERDHCYLNYLDGYDPVACERVN